MRLIYNLAIHLLTFAIRLAALKNPKARLWVEGRKKLIRRIRAEKEPAEKTIWFHCASLGEFEQGRPLIEEVKRNFPDKKIVLTFFSPSGYEVRKNYPGADYVYYLPADTPRNARNFIRTIHPEIAFFIKYEYWLNYLLELKKLGTPAYFVSCIFRPGQLFFKKRGVWYRNLLRLVCHFFLQDEASGVLLESIGIKDYSVCGDTRFDRVAHISEKVKPLPLVEEFLEGGKALVAGSSWKAEEALLLQYHRSHPTQKIIIVPHEVTAENIARIEKQFGANALCYSKATRQNVTGKSILIVDAYGLLLSVYPYGKLAIIGGGFGAGIHNVLEAATFGLPVIFGPNYRRFREAVDLVDRKCAFSVLNIEEFNAVVNHLRNNPLLIDTLSQQSISYVREHIGATQKIMGRVFNR